MGFFSWECKSDKCGNHSIIAPYGGVEGIEWMTKAVAVTSGGSVIMGDYDGYGRRGCTELMDLEDFTLWHRACWEAEGKPIEFQGQSDHANDQGFFFENSECPKAPEPPGR